MSAPFGAAFWDERYGRAEWVYGTEPNALVAAHAHLIPPGPVLCLAEGEGRNAAFLAGRGHAVTAVDQSAAGLAKARRLAAERGVAITTVVADLSEFPIPRGAWAGVIATFAHLPRPLRRAVHARAAAGLLPGGVVILEAYSPAQVRHRTGGPVSEPSLLMDLAEVRQEFPGLEWLVAQEIERPVVEGTGHTGIGAVVQLVGRRPAALAGAESAR